MLKEGRTINSWGEKRGRKGRFLPLPPTSWKCTVLVIEKGMCCWQGHGRRADEDLMRICTAFGLKEADASEGSLGWLGKGKHTLPNSSGRLKTTECPEGPWALKDWEDFPKASPAVRGRPCPVCTKAQEWSPCSKLCPICPVQSSF